MKPARRTLLTTIVVAASLSIVSGTKASCAAPSISLSRHQAKPGQKVTIIGDAFIDGCDDTGGGSCFGDDDGEPSEPMRNIALEMYRKGDRANPIHLANIHAEHDGTFEVTVSIPTSVSATIPPPVAPGRYFVTAEGWGRVPLEIKK